MADQNHGRPGESDFDPSLRYMMVDNMPEVFHKAVVGMIVVEVEGMGMPGQWKQESLPVDMGAPVPVVVVHRRLAHCMSAAHLSSTATRKRVHCTLVDSTEGHLKHGLAVGAHVLGGRMFHKGVGHGKPEVVAAAVVGIPGRNCLDIATQEARPTGPDAEYEGVVEEG